MSTTQVPTGLFVSGLPVVRSETGDVTGLPEPQPDTVFLVSLFVLSACKNRTDVFAPDTGSTCVRNSAGHIVGVRQFIGR